MVSNVADISPIALMPDFDDGTNTPAPPTQGEGLNPTPATRLITQTTTIPTEEPVGSDREEERNISARREKDEFEQFLRYKEFLRKEKGKSLVMNSSPSESIRPSKERCTRKASHGYKVDTTESGSSSDEAPRRKRHEKKSRKETIF